MCFRPAAASKVLEPCPQCQAMKDPLAVCPKCGYVPEIECPQCHTKLPVTCEKCSNCGYQPPKAPPPPGVSSAGFAVKAPPPGQSGGIVPPKAPPPPGVSSGLTPPKAPPAPPKAPPAPPKKPGE